MNTKTCSKCGWEYPIEWPGRKCRFCGEPFLESPCSHCGTITTLRNGVCRPCETRQHAAWVRERKNLANDAMRDWLKKISNIPQPYKTLTEDEWLEACKHFGGCAYCGDANIDSRSMFISFKTGGRYCAWNILPACEKCETLRRSESEHYFLRMDNMLRRGNKEPAKKHGFTLEKLNKITEYLQSKMEVNE